MENPRYLLSDLVRDYYWCTDMNDLQILSPNLIPPQTRKVYKVSLTPIEVGNDFR